MKLPSLTSSSFGSGQQADVLLLGKLIERTAVDRVKLAAYLVCHLDHRHLRVSPCEELRDVNADKAAADYGHVLSGQIHGGELVHVRNDVERGEHLAVLRIDPLLESLYRGGSGAGAGGVDDDVRMQLLDLFDAAVSLGEHKEIVRPAARCVW